MASAIWWIYSKNSQSLRISFDQGDLTNILVYISIKLLHVHWKKNLKLVWARGVVEGQGLHRASQVEMEDQLESQFTKLETASRN